MESRADTGIRRILKHEGGYVDHPKDPGGATNKGITIGTYRAYINPKGTKAQLKALTTAQAVTVYKRQYWDAVRADSLPVGVDYAVADFAVNSGPYRASQFLQRAVGVKADGRIGPNTLAAVKGLNAAEVITKLCNARLNWMRGLNTWKVFGRGWTSRVNRVKADALADAANQQPVDYVKSPNTAKRPWHVDLTRLSGLIEAILNSFRRS